VIQDGGRVLLVRRGHYPFSGALLGALYDIPHIRYDGYRVSDQQARLRGHARHGTVKSALR